MTTKTLTIEQVLTLLAKAPTLRWPIGSSVYDLSSGLPRIGVMQTAQDGASNDPSASRRL
jgi:hypothetical protein